MAYCVVNEVRRGRSDQTGAEAISDLSLQQPVLALSGRNSRKVVHEHTNLAAFGLQV